MNVYVPDYYLQFHCIANQCKHTCCEGWEIDIDEESLIRYQAMRGEFGERMRACIDEEEAPHFLLDEHERCPLLNDQNLCELILNCGEESLCQICKDHPRFRNYWSDRTEIGLGMACEEAARIILTSDHPMGLIRLEGDDPAALDETEQWLMDYRQQMLDNVAEQGPAARLREYLIYRHIADALYDGRVEERTAFVNSAFGMITRGWEGSLADLIERCRVFSNEIEYDDEKLETEISSREGIRIAF